MTASYSSFEDIVCLLLEAGANVSVRDADGDTALMLAVRQGHVDIAAILKAAGMLSDRPTGVRRVSRTKQDGGRNGGTVSRVCPPPCHGRFNASNAATARSCDYSFPCSTRSFQSLEA
jgi:ankyrin repeat protein